MVSIIIHVVVSLLLYLLLYKFAIPILKLACSTIDNWVTYSFFIEEVFNDAVGEYFNVGNLCNAIFYFALMYLILCFIVRLIQVYFSWSNGDPETSPITVVMGFMKALIVMLVFGVCYEYFVKIIYQMYQAIISSAFNGLDISQIIDAFDFSFVTSLVTAIIILIVAIEIFLIYIDVLTRGIQMLILRLGTAFAAIGLLNADGGSFKGYIKKYIQNAFAILVQIFLTYLAIVLLKANNYMLSLVTISVALKGATMMKEFIGADTGSVGSGGLMSTMATAGQAGRFARGVTGAINGVGSIGGKLGAGVGAVGKSIGQTFGGGSSGKTFTATKGTAANASGKNGTITGGGNSTGGKQKLSLGKNMSASDNGKSTSKWGSFTNKMSTFGSNVRSNYSDMTRTERNLSSSDKKKR